jgi:hypothetical protein
VPVVPVLVLVLVPDTLRALFLLEACYR